MIANKSEITKQCVFDFPKSQIFSQKYIQDTTNDFQERPSSAKFKVHKFDLQQQWQDSLIIKNRARKSKLSQMC